MLPIQSITACFVACLSIASAVAPASEWSSEPVTLIPEVPLVLSSNGFMTAEFLPNLTFNDKLEENFPNSYKAQFHLRSYTLDGELRRSCKVGLLGSYEIVLNQNFRLAELDVDTAVLRYNSMSLKRRQPALDLAVVDLVKCEQIHRRFPFDSQRYDNFEQFDSAVLALHDDTFDLVLPAKFLCGGDLCIVPYDPVKQVLGEPTLLLDKVQANEDWVLAPLASFPSSRGYFLAVQDSAGVKVLSVGVTRQASQAATLTNEHSAIESHSTAHGVFGTCFAHNATVNCSQVGASVNATLDLGYEATSLVMHNLPKGGFLLVSSNDAGDVHLAVVGPDGQPGENAKIAEVRCDEPPAFRVLEAGGKICAQHVCRRKSGPREVRNVLRVLCF